jgi:hypothetical protein
MATMFGTPIVMAAVAAALMTFVRPRGLGTQLNVGLLGSLLALGAH